MKIVICGSMTTAKEMLIAKDHLSKLGHEVFLPEFTEEYSKLKTEENMHSESSENKIKYDLIKSYYNVIKNGDAVLVMNIERKNISGYIGGNTFIEMAFAHVLDKAIYLFNDIPDMGYADEIKAMRPIVLNGDVNVIKTTK